MGSKLGIPWGSCIDHTQHTTHPNGHTFTHATSTVELFSASQQFVGCFVVHGAIGCGKCWSFPLLINSPLKRLLPISETRVNATSWWNTAVLLSWEVVTLNYLIYHFVWNGRRWETNWNGNDTLIRLRVCEKHVKTRHCIYQNNISTAQGGGGSFQR